MAFKYEKTDKVFINALRECLNLDPITWETTPRKRIPFKPAIEGKEEVDP